MTPDNTLANSLREDDDAALAALDAGGFCIGRDEDFAAYKQRLLATGEANAGLENALSGGDPAEILPGIMVTRESRIGSSVVEAAGEVTEALYAFRIRHVPGFFLSENIGLLWAGCSISDSDSPLSVILLRRNFKNKQRYLIYDRTELAAHEFCHAARCGLADLPLEEFFAYRTSGSRFRRYFGNCFIHQRDAVLFLLPILLLLSASIVQAVWFYGLPMWPFWTAALAYPAFLLTRNFLSIRIFRRAEAALRSMGTAMPEAVLFRSTHTEMKAMTRTRTASELTELLKKWAASSLRWRVVAYRFLKS